jgi:transcriptional regulator with XRE-family HTH domain
MVQPKSAVGELLREWRKRRRMSQLDLAGEAGISARHLSFIETGRSLPSREMMLHLAEWLGVPLRERNILLSAAGYAAVFSARPLDDPVLSAAREAVDLVLKGHEPYPAIAIDRYWNLVAANGAVAPLLAGVAAGLLDPPVNVLRLSLHPEGLAPRIANLTEWRSHLLERLHRQLEVSADPRLAALMDELAQYPHPKLETLLPRDYAGVVIPLQLQSERGLLSLISTITVFGTPIDVTLSELAMETFFPADAQTAQLLGVKPGG